MARNRKIDDFVMGDDEDVPDPVRGTVSVAQEASPPIPEPALPSWRVTLDCPTPIAHKTLVLQAPDEHAARRAFNAINGISGSSYAYAISLVNPGEAVEAAEQEPILQQRQPKPLPGWALLRADPAVGEVRTGVLLAFDGRMPLKAGDRFAIPPGCAYQYEEYLLVRLPDLACALP